MVNTGEEKQGTYNVREDVLAALYLWGNKKRLIIQKTFLSISHFCSILKGHFFIHDDLSRGLLKIKVTT